MAQIKPETARPALLVSAYKHQAFVKVQTAIVVLAIAQDYVSCSDIPEDIVGEKDRQGVVSNAWNVLRSLDIIERLPMSYNDEARKIFGGRTRNTNQHAKGRWTAVYRLKNRTLANLWLKRNMHQLAPVEEQMELV